MRRILPILVVLLAATGPVYAHAHLHASAPEAGSTGTAPTTVEISFTEALEPKFSTIDVTDAAGRRVDQSDLHTVQADPKRVAVGLKPLSAGVYTVVWHATSVDTHKTEGHFTFTVAQ